MPRTKLEKNDKNENINNVKIKQENIDPGRENVCEVWLSMLEQELKMKLLEISNQKKFFLSAMNNISFEEFTASVLSTKADKTRNELIQEKSFAYNGTTISDASKSILKNSTIFKSFNTTANNTLANTGRKKKKTDDEGYLTAGDSGRSTSIDRTTRSRSRSTVKQDTKKSRVSRSLSRSKAPKIVSIQAPYKTPDQRRFVPPASYGLVTPKVKPNTPLSILRRPKQGEMAISMQGSPLLVSGVITETCANVNIPLEDGRILSLQPSRSLRMSEIPNLDEHTRLQLVALRDNLNKVVKMANEC